MKPVDPKKCSKQIFEKYRKRHSRDAKKDIAYIYCIFEKQTGTLIGVADIFIICRSQYQMGNLGYKILNCHWGKGFGQEIARATIEFGFKHLKLNRLEASIDRGNKRSVKLVKAIGMRPEGIKKRYWFQNGRFDDQITYSANPEDYGYKNVSRGQ